MLWWQTGGVIIAAACLLHYSKTVLKTCLGLGQQSSGICIRYMKRTSSVSTLVGALYLGRSRAISLQYLCIESQAFLHDELLTNERTVVPDLVHLPVSCEVWNEVYEVTRQIFYSYRKASAGNLDLITSINSAMGPMTGLVGPTFAYRASIWSLWKSIHRVTCGLKTWNVKSTRIFSNPFGKICDRASFGATFKVMALLSSFHMVDTCSQWACKICTLHQELLSINISGEQYVSRIQIAQNYQSKPTRPLWVLKPCFIIVFLTHFIRWGKSEIKYKNLCLPHGWTTMHWMWFRVARIPRMFHMDLFQGALSKQM